MTPIADSARLVTFRLGNDLFAAELSAVERVVRYAPPRVIPDVPAWMVGVTEYQGRVVPVIDLRRRFELEGGEPGQQTRMLILSSGSELVAVIVDAVLDVRSTEESELAPRPALFRGLAGEYLRGLARRDGELVVVLDADKLLSSTERLALQPAIRDHADG